MAERWIAAGSLGLTAALPDARADSAIALVQAALPKPWPFLLHRWGRGRGGGAHDRGRGDLGCPDGP